MISIGLSFVASIILMAFAEYAIHRWYQHGCGWRMHADLHHGRGMNDPELIDLSPLLALGVASPLLLPMAVIWPDASGCLAAVVVGHAYIWTQLHRAFHAIPSPAAGWLGYAYLHRYHIKHHAYPNRNYGAVFGPAVDFLFRTVA